MIIPQSSPNQNESALRSKFSDNGPRLSFGELYQTISRRRVYLLAFLAIGVIAGITYGLRSKEYTASGQLRVEPGHSAAYESSPLSAMGQGDEKISAEVAVLSTNTVFLKVAQELNLANDPSFLSSTDKFGGSNSLDDPVTRDKVLKEMRKRIVIGRAPNEEIVHITCTTRSATRSAQIVNTLTDLYIQRVFQMRYGTANRVAGWMISQLDGLRGQVEKDQESIIALQQRLGVLGVDPKNSNYLTSETLGSLSRAYSDATVERIIAQARAKNLSAMSPNLIESETPLLPGKAQGSQSSLLQSLRAQKATAESNFAKLSQKYDVEYPDVKQAKAELDALNAEIVQEESRILKQANVAYDAARENEELTADTLNSRKNEAFDLRKDIVSYAVLQQEYDSHRNLYEGLMRHLREESIDAGMESADVDILDVAIVPTKPSGLGRALSLLLGSLIGALIGAGVALLVDMFDSRVTDPLETQALLNLPLISTFPKLAPDEVLHTESHTIAASAFRESMELLRNNLLLTSADHAPRLICITSALPAEGKSTTSRNLAMTFAQHGARTLLIDADLRRPTQHGRFQITNRVGLSTLLSSEIGLQEAILPAPGIPSLYLLPSGPPPPNPPVLLGSARMKSLMVELCGKYDFVILDTPPVLSASDTVLMGTLADAFVLVVRQKLGTRRGVAEARDLLLQSGINLVGFVMNAVDYNSPGYGSYYGYGRYYGAYQAESGESANE